MSNDFEALKLVEGTGSLTLYSDSFAGDGDETKNWLVTPLDDDRYLLQSQRSRVMMADDATGFCKAPVEVFGDFLVGLSRRRWSGMVAADIGIGVIRLFFREGELCFGSSNVIDHRLGEVIYRQARITLEELTECAVEVNRSNKFGQVLLQKGIFSTVDLWDALKLQVTEIMRSAFLVDSVYFEVKPGVNLAPTEVVFTRGTETLVTEALSFGNMFREFLQRLNNQVKVKLKSNERVAQFAAGTFTGDLLQMIRDQGELAKVVASSKLEEVNTLVEVMSLVNRTLVGLEGAASVEVNVPRGVSSLKTKIDAYSVLLRSCKQAFDTQGAVFPFEDLNQFVNHLNIVGFESIYINEHGEIDRDSKLNLFSQCQTHARRADFFVVRIEAMIQYLMHVTGDLLPQEVSHQVRTIYRQISA